MFDLGSMERFRRENKIKGKYIYFRSFLSLFKSAHKSKIKTQLSRLDGIHEYEINMTMLEVCMPRKCTAENFV